MSCSGRSPNLGKRRNHASQQKEAKGKPSKPLQRRRKPPRSPAARRRNTARGRRRPSRRQLKGRASWKRLEPAWRALVVVCHASMTQHAAITLQPLWVCTKWKARKGACVACLGRGEISVVRASTSLASVLHSWTPFPPLPDRADRADRPTARPRPTARQPDSRRSTARPTSTDRPTRRPAAPRPPVCARAHPGSRRRPPKPNATHRPTARQPHRLADFDRPPDRRAATPPE